MTGGQGVAEIRAEDRTGRISSRCAAQHPSRCLWAIGANARAQATPRGGEAPWSRGQASAAPPVRMIREKKHFIRNPYKLICGRRGPAVEGLCLASAAPPRLESRGLTPGTGGLALAASGLWTRRKQGAQGFCPSERGPRACQWVPVSPERALRAPNGTVMPIRQLRIRPAHGALDPCQWPDRSVRLRFSGLK